MRNVIISMHGVVIITEQCVYTFYGVGGWVGGGGGGGGGDSTKCP